MPALIVLGGAGVLLMLQPDLGTAIVTVAIVIGDALHRRDARSLRSPAQPP